jgi:hypothetical protein
MTSTINAAATDSLSEAQAMTTLIAAGGFLLTALTLSINLSAPGQSRPRMGSAHFHRGMFAICVIMTVVAAGALSAWASIFTGGSIGSFSRSVTACALLLVIVAQPIIGFLLVKGAKVKKSTLSGRDT